MHSTWLLHALVTMQLSSFKQNVHYEAIQQTKFQNKIKANLGVYFYCKYFSLPQTSGPRGHEQNQKICREFVLALGLSASLPPSLRNPRPWAIASSSHFALCSDFVLIIKLHFLQQISRLCIPFMPGNVGRNLGKLAVWDTKETDFRCCWRGSLQGIWRLRPLQHT